MTLKQTLKQITRREPEKTFIKAGFLDEYENITIDGMNALNFILWNEKKEELKKLAQQIQEENESKINAEEEKK